MAKVERYLTMMSETHKHNEAMAEQQRRLAEAKSKNPNTRGR